MTNTFKNLIKNFLENNLINDEVIQEINPHDEEKAIILIVSSKQFILNCDKANEAWNLLSKKYLNNENFLYKLFNEIKVKPEKDLFILILKKYIDSNLLQNINFMKKSVLDYGFYHLFDFDIKNIEHKNILLNMIKEKNYTFSYLDYDFKNSKDFILEALSKNIDIAKYIYDKFRDNYEIMELAIKSKPISFKYASDRLKNDLNIATLAVKKRGANLKYAPYHFKDDKEFVLLAIKKDPLSLKYASDRLKNDKDIAKIAITKRGDALEFVSNDIQDDKGFVLLAIKKDPLSLKYASDRLKNDKDVVKEGLKNFIAYKNSKYISKNIKKDEEVFECIFKAYKENFLFIYSLQNEEKKEISKIIDSKTWIRTILK
ncbi:DUF4116 domain-containing protein [Mesomycoplasma molare]|uniref:DUF4116 domain-containing protein n=1 Tax=Mesomycoplasma molare TaxID=171288 RepID=A0ABY5TUG3_9BACT|nr:DUF4116 domain-containing protein [Mesomycoplasma molare]UWD33974.1 DUF4116 domain-containing protein [Mesomycoplasma molare]